MILREYRDQDLDRLYEIDRICFPQGIAYSRRELAFYITWRGAITLVVEDPATRAIAGFLVAHKEGKRWGHIITIDVRPEYRRNRMGSRLLTATEDRLWATGLRVIYLETAVDNTAAIRFYEQHGYRITHRLSGYYQGKLDAYRMCKSKEDPI